MRNLQGAQDWPASSPRCRLSRRPAAQPVPPGCPLTPSCGHPGRCSRLSFPRALIYSSRASGFRLSPGCSGSLLAALFGARLGCCSSSSPCWPSSLTVFELRSAAPAAAALGSSRQRAKILAGVTAGLSRQGMTSSLGGGSCLSSQHLVEICHQTPYWRPLRSLGRAFTNPGSSNRAGTSSASKLRGRAPAASRCVASSLPTKSIAGGAPS